VNQSEKKLTRDSGLHFRNLSWLSNIEIWEKSDSVSREDDGGVR
jgi:hypothetical protein